MRTPQRHHSESVLYLNDEHPKHEKTKNNNFVLSCLQQQSLENRDRPSRSNSRLFPISTYIELPTPHSALDQKYVEF